MLNNLNASVNSTSAHPPLAIPGHLFRFSVSGVGPLVRAFATPWQFDTRDCFKTVKAQAIKLVFYYFAMAAFMGNFTSQWLVGKGLHVYKLVEISRGELLILESFPVLYRSNYLSYIIYRKINVAKEEMFMAFN